MSKVEYLASQSISRLDDRAEIRLLLVAKNVLDSKSGTLDIVKLRHPRTGVGATFLFAADNSIVQEVFSFAEKKSWFIDNNVRESGKVYFSTPVDPLFLLLPYLKKSKENGKVIPFEDLIADETFPETTRLIKSSALKNIHSISDRKGPEDLNAWMYNEEKTIKWLTMKAKAVARILKEKQINVRKNSASKNFVKVLDDEPKDFSEKLYLKYAFELLSEYLMDDLSLKLSSTLGISFECADKTTANKRKPSQSIAHEIDKKFKADEKCSISKVGKNRDALLKEYKKQKAVNKSITSFFVKK